MPPRMPLGCTQRHRDQPPKRRRGHLTQLQRSRRLPPPPPEPPPCRGQHGPSAARLPAPTVPWAHACLAGGSGSAPWTARSASWRGASCMGSCASAPSYDTSIRAQLQPSSAPMPAAQTHCATLSHIFITCPVAAQVLAWVCAIWAAITGEAAPPRSTDLFLADDRRMWTPAPALLPLWQRLRLAMLASLHVAHRAGRAHPTAQQTARAVAARIMAQLRADMQRDWILVGGGLRRAGGMCSAWYRGRDAQAYKGGLPGALLPPRRAVLPDRGRWRAAVPLDRCRAGAAASMTIPRGQ